MSRRGFRTRKLKIREKFIAKPRRLIDLTFVETKTDIVVTLRQNIRLSSATVGWLNIYLAIIGGEILANTQKRPRAFLGCISAPERDFKDRISG